MDEIAWYDKIPDGGRVTEATHRGSFFYELRGTSGRWFVIRRSVLTGQPQRTKFHKNMAAAGEVFEHLIA